VNRHVEFDRMGECRRSSTTWSCSPGVHRSPISAYRAAHCCGSTASAVRRNSRRKEGKQRVKLTRLGCHRLLGQPGAAVVQSDRPQSGPPLAAIPATPTGRHLVADQLAAAVGKELIQHAARYYWLLLAKGHLTRPLSAGTLGGARRCWITQVQTRSRLRSQRWSPWESGGRMFGRTAFSGVA
jgi:hypothetical protein